MHTPLRNYLQAGFHLESTHQIALSILFKDINFQKHIFGRIISNPIIELEPHNRDFDIGIKESQKEAYSILIEVKMWADTNIGQIEKQLIRTEGKNLIYIVIGCKGENVVKKLNSEVKDIYDIIDALKNCKNNPIADTYLLLLNDFLNYFKKSDLVDSLPKKEKLIFYTSSHLFIKNELNKKEINVDLFSTSSGGGRDVRLYAQNLNKPRVRDDEFHLDLHINSNILKFSFYIGKYNIPDDNQIIIDFSKNIIDRLPSDLKPKNKIKFGKNNKYVYLIQKKFNFCNKMEIWNCIILFEKLNNLFIGF